MCFDDESFLYQPLFLGEGGAGLNPPSNIRCIPHCMTQEGSTCLPVNPHHGGKGGCMHGQTAFCT